EDLIDRGEELDQRLRFDPTLTRIAHDFAETSFDPATAEILTDEFAPVDRLIQLGRSPRADRRQGSGAAAVPCGPTSGCTVSTGRCTGSTGRCTGPTSRCTCKRDVVLVQ